MLVTEVMTPSPVRCKPVDRLDRVAKLMLDRDCGAVPVCSGTKLLGVITDRDIVLRAIAKGETPVAIAASDVMSQPVITINENAPVEAAIDLMKTKLIRRLFVVDDDKELVGVLSPSDLAPFFASKDVADFLLAVSYWNHRNPTHTPAPASVVS